MSGETTLEAHRKVCILLVSVCLDNLFKMRPAFTALLTLNVILILSTFCVTSCGKWLHRRSSSESGELKVKQELSKVRFTSDGKLRIAQFADLHYGEAPDTEWGPSQDLRSTQVIENILGWEDPEFVIFTGDQLTAEFMYPNATDYVHILLRPLVEKQYRWASVYGNHDIGANLTRLEILEAEQTYTNLCYTQRMNPDLPGVTNYFIPIYGPEGGKDQVDQEEKPVMIWWFFDSQGGRNQFGQQPHYIDPAVVDWFRDESSRLREQWGVLPSLVFFHIPPQEYTAVQESVATNDQCTGLLDDDVTPQDNNTGIMVALREAGGVKTVFVGHDHGNAWCCFYEEIQVCYNRHTGYGGYGSWTRGSRVILLELTNNSTTMTQTNYVRLENGTIVDNFPKENISVLI